MKRFPFVLSRLLFSIGVLVVGLLWPWASLQAAGPQAPASDPVYKIVIRNTGLYRVTYTDLVAAGFDPTGKDTGTFRLFHNNEEVAFFLFDGGDHRFDPGDYFLFYAEEKLTKYTDVDIYWFQAGGATRVVPATRDGTPGSAPVATAFWRTLHFEQDKIYRSNMPLTGEANRWYWLYYKACTPGDRTCRDADGNKNDRAFTLTLPHVSPEPHTARLRVVLWGQFNDAPDPDHRFSTLVNGTLVGESTFEGAVAYQGLYDVPGSLLVSGANTVRLQFPLMVGASNDGYIDSLEMTYLSRFVALNNALGFGGSGGRWQYAVEGFADPNIMALDVSDPHRPVLIAGVVVSGSGPYTATFEAESPLAAATTAGAGSFFVVSSNGWLTPQGIFPDSPSNLRDPANGADYIVITHANFMAQAQQLATYRATANGYRTAVIDVQDIYDEFNNGLMSAEAIRAFLFYASHYWQPPRPQFVVLIGDGHYDFLNHLGANEPVYIPPYLLGVDPFQGETAADNRFVDVLGDEQYDSDGGPGHTARDIVITGGRMHLAVDFGFHPPVVAQAVLAATPPVTAPSSQAVSLSAAPTAPQLVKAIGDKVFWDEDRDGIWDAPERGVPGVTVHLWAEGSIVQTQVTDAEGNFFFEDLPSNTYTLQFIPPAGWQFTTYKAGGDDRYDSDVHPDTGFTDPIAYVFPGQAQANWDAGLVWPGTIGNRVWLDTNANGLQEAGEPGIGGVLVELLQAGSVIATTTTDADGYYFFHGLPDGVYDVRIAAANFAGGALDGFVASPWDEGVDLMPDLSLGRFPVNTVAEAQEMVNRVLQYELNAPSGDWPKRVVFVSDDPDGAGNFYEHSDAVADSIWPYPADAVKIYYKQTHTTSAAVRSAILAAINQGALFVTYNGHSSKRTWGELFFDAADVDLLSNSIFPVFVPMTCLEGYYIAPGFVSMGEKAVRTLGKGAIASFSPTGLGVATGHQFLYKAFFNTLVAGETQLGPLTLAAKDALFQSHSIFKDLLDDYVLFGDPALQVQMPRADVQIAKTVQPGGTITPGQTITYTLTYTNAGILTATNVVITDGLPAGLLNPVVSSTPPLTPDPGTSFVWTVGDLAPGAGGVITITATVDPGLGSNTVIVNTAVIAAANDGDPITANQATATSPIAGTITLGGVTWYDVNGNGLREGTETLPVTSVSITAVRVGFGDSYSTTSDATGNWVLTGLPAGTYDITAALPPHLAATTPTTVQVTVLAGGANTDIHFGFISPTAVTLAAFTATVETTGVVLRWQTGLEQDLVGFYVYRSADPTAHGKRISGLIPAAGMPASYTFTDAWVREGGWYYWLEAVEHDAVATFFGPVLATPAQGWQKLYLGRILHRR
jgi:uncharacterized repeat protein (TIGR01451 family)